MATNTGEVPNVATYLLHFYLTIALPRWIDYFMIHTPEEDFHRLVKQHNENGKEKLVPEPIPQNLWAKLEWGFNLNISFRGVGWNIQSENIPEGPPEGYSRIRFGISQLLYIGIAQVMIEYIYLIMAATPYLSSSGRPDFSSDKYTTQAMVGYLVMANFYFSLRTIQAILSIIFTSIGYTTPSMWRPVFGTIIYDTTVRDRWGKGWHQLIRGSVSSPGKWLCKQLSFEKGSFKSKYTQLYVGMFVSAVAHSRPASPTTSYPYTEYVFFLLQATYIMVEDHLSDWFEKKGYTNNAWSRLFDYTIVFFWFALTTPICAYGTITDGLLATQPHPPLHLLRSLPCDGCASFSGMVLTRGVQTSLVVIALCMFQKAVA